MNGEINLEFEVHWFGIVAHCEKVHFMRIVWDPILKIYFRDLESMKHGGRGYKEIEFAVMGVQLYSESVSGCHVNLVIPGAACQCLPAEVYSKIIKALIKAGVRFSVKRMDFAWNNPGFTVKQFRGALLAEGYKTWANRESIEFMDSPNKKQEDGITEGCMTCYVGSRSSERFLRVYNEHGYDRIEFVVKDERAHMIALELLGVSWYEWEEKIKAHLAQYIEVYQSWWVDFMQNICKAQLKVHSAKEVSLERIKRYLNVQVSAALYVYNKVEGDISEILERGCHVAAKHNKYNVILAGAV